MAKHVLDGRARALDEVGQGDAFVIGKRCEYEVGDIAVHGPADTHANAHELGAAGASEDVTQAIVPAVTTAALDRQPGEFEIDLVVHDHEPIVGHL